MAEWLKALVLKTREGNLRRFESCPFRQVPKGTFLIDVDFGARSSVNAKIGEGNHFVVFNHMSRVQLCALKFVDIFENFLNYGVGS